MKSVPIRNIKTSNKGDNIGKILIKRIEDLRLNEDLDQPVHRHDFYFVLAVKKGQGSHTIDFISYDVHDYSVFFMRPGQVHELHLQQECTGFILEFSKDYLHSKHKKTRLLLRAIGQQNLYSPELNSFQRFVRYLTTIREELESENEEFQDAVKANLQLALIELYRSRENRSLHPDANEKYKQEQLDLFLELLENDIANHKQVNDYATMMHMTSYQLNQITKRLLGKTCSQVINEQIILEAKRLLLVTSQPISEVAWQLGYEDVSYFIRFFKKQTGYPPEGYRQNFK